ncbi:MAG: hypothetical protein AB1597_02800 [Chloroflexota bacterium]
MFWKKDKSGHVSPKDALISEIEGLTTGQAIRYRLTDTFGGGLAVIGLNPEYPAKGARYVLCTEALANEKPSGNKRTLFDTNKAKLLADWIFDRNGQRYA